MTQGLIVDQQEFEEFCEHVRASGEVAFDTEFVSEYTYRPELCLLQFATRERCVAVDPFAVTDLSSWWRIMSGGETLVVVHGGREEVRYCMRYARLPPGKLADVQVAEGLQSRSFPLSYSALVSRVLNKRTHGKETRTDWRRRPLSPAQIAYALEDVQFLLQVWNTQRSTLSKRGRLPWAEAEFARMVSEIQEENTRENWRRLPGIMSLNPRELAVVREIYEWREQEGERRDRLVRKVLRDDLIIELARRQPQDQNDLLATRDMNRSDYRRVAVDMLAAISRALALPDNKLPPVIRPRNDQDEHVLAQLLSIALANRCAQTEVAMGLVGTNADLKHLVRWHVYAERDGIPPRLTQGWRAEVCGDLLTDVLAGKIALRISDPHSDHPLVFERLDGRKPSTDGHPQS